LKLSGNPVSALIISVTLDALVTLRQALLLNRVEQKFNKRSTLSWLQCIQ